MAESKSPNEVFEELKELLEKQTSTDEDPTRLLVLLREKLYEMVRIPLKDEYNAEVFNWVAQLCLSVGDLSWISPDGSWTQHEARIFSCITRLSLNELQIILPLVTRHLTCGDEPEIDDGKVMARSANTEDYERFGNHLIIIESTIKSLLKHQDEDSEDNGLTRAMSPRELQSLLERLKETLALVFEYLELVHQRWNHLMGRKLSDSSKFEAAQGALRLMSVWLSEEPQTFDCGKYMIDLLVKNLMLTDRPTKDDLAITALHAVCVSDRKMFDLLHEIPDSSEVLDRYLKLAESEKKSKQGERRAEKVFKLRLGLIKDLLEFYS